MFRRRLSVHRLPGSPRHPAEALLCLPPRGRLPLCLFAARASGPSPPARGFPRPESFSGQCPPLLQARCSLALPARLPPHSPPPAIRQPVRPSIYSARIIRLNPRRARRARLHHD